MGEPERNEKESKRLPEGFLMVSFDQVLGVIGMTIVCAGIIGSHGEQYFACILAPGAIVCCIAAVVARRRVRKFVREHGEVDVCFTFSPGVRRPKKNVLFREVGELIDAAIDRVLDGKGQGSR